MTKRNELLALAERAEQAGADEQREVCAAALEAIFGTSPLPEAPEWLPWVSRWERFDRCVWAEAFESAAMMLLPEGWTWEISGGGSTPYAHLEEPGYNPDTYNGYSEGSSAATPALALVAAALRAQAGEGE